MTEADGAGERERERESKKGTMKNQEEAEQKLKETWRETEERHWTETEQKLKATWRETEERHWTETEYKLKETWRETENGILRRIWEKIYILLKNWSEPNIF